MYNIAAIIIVVLQNILDAKLGYLCAINEMA